MKKLALSFILAVGMAGMVKAQGVWNWPEDPAARQKAEESNALYTDNKNAENYDGARAPLHWLLVNTPSLNESIYINGEKVYENLAKKATDAAARKNFVDSLFLVLDKRLEYFPSASAESRVAEMKVFHGYTFFQTDKSRYDEIIASAEKAFELKGDKTSSFVIPFYFNFLKLKKQAFPDQVSDDFILEKYDELTAMVERRKASGENAKTLDLYQGYLDDFLAELKLIDCNYIENKLLPKLQANQSDVKVAKQIVSYSIQYKCTDSDAFLTAAQVVQAAEPNYGMTKVLADRFQSMGQIDKAISYYNQAIELATEKSDKASGHLELARIYEERGQRGTARKEALNAAEIDPAKASTAYSFIGAMIFRSYDQCKAGVSIVDDRAIFIAAYEYFRKAGDNERMAQARAQFPSKEEIFTATKSVGDKVTVGCWINETVTLQTRD